MASPSIASGAVTISASADQLAQGLQQSGKKVETWAGGLSGKLGSIFKGGLVFGAAARIGSELMEIPGKVLGKFKEMKEGLDHASKSARAFGTDMGTWQGIVHAADLAGIGVEQLESGLARFRKQVDGPIDAALFGLAKRLEGVKDPGERARVLVENFGKSGIKMAGLFEGGEEGLRALVAEAERLGFALSEADGKAIEEANDAVRRTEKAVDGLWNKVVVALAPAFTEAANRLTEWIVMGQPVFDWFARALTQAHELASLVWDAMVAGIMEAFDWVKELASGLFVLAAGMPTVQEVIVSMFRAVGTAAAYAWDTIKAGAGVITVVASLIVDGFGMVVKVFKEVIALAKELPEQLRPDGLDGFIAGIERFEESVHGAAAKMREWGKGAVLNFGQGARDFNMWLDAALAKKKKAEAPFQPRIEGQFGMGPWQPAKFAEAIEKGSKEAYSISVRNRFGEFMPKQDDVKDELKRGNKQREKGNADLADIRKRLRELEEI